MEEQNLKMLGNDANASTFLKSILNKITQPTVKLTSIKEEDEIIKDIPFPEILDTFICSIIHYQNSTIRVRQ